MSNHPKNQTSLFKGIYEFSDPSGVLLAAKVPAVGSVDLYSGTALIVRPNQCALFIYKGQIADVFMAGTHEIKTENTPILTKLANWKFGFESPLRCELIFIAGHAFTSRRWGTPQPILAPLKDIGTVPIRAYGQFNFVVSQPQLFFSKLVGTRTTYSVSDIEEFIQGQIVELLPTVFQDLTSLEDISRSYNDLSLKLEEALQKELAEFGLQIQKIQILSALPSKEVLEAMEAKTAIKIIGSQKEYLLYKAANSLDQVGAGDQNNNPMQMMMGMMLSKGLLSNDYHEKEKALLGAQAHFCSQCGNALKSEDRFCSQCGKKV